MDRRLLAAAGTLSALGIVAGAVGLGGRQLLHRQAAIARRIIGKPLGETPPHADRVWKKRYGGPEGPIELLLLGDSIAAGLGAERRKDTLGGRLAKEIAKHQSQAVRLTTGAVVGSESSRLAAQLDGLPSAYRPDVAVIVVGGNDVIHRVPTSESVGHLEAAITRLREAGTPVVVGTCPDLGALRPVPQPLRALGSRVSRQLAAAQADAAVAAGAHVVPLARVVGPFFVADPDGMFSLDRFHPSALGYRRTASALLPSVLLALGLDDRVPSGHLAPTTVRA